VQRRSTLIARRIRRAREDELRISQQELADRARLHVRTVERLEAGEHVPKVSTATRLEHVLGTSRGELLELRKRMLGGGYAAARRRMK
jgi:ribosome-binding protein aMBF1 (putative translation factor)